MAPSFDIRRLAPAAIVRLLNSTPLGEVLTAAVLKKHRDAAGLRIGDARTVDLLKYVGWLAGQLEAEEAAPARSSAAQRYVETRKKQAERNRAATRAAQDIAPIPKIEDFQRRAACRLDFKRFCETYFSQIFWKKWSGDHLRVIAKIEKAVLEGGLFAFAMPRGSGKTCLARCAALWAVLYGHHEYVCLIAGNQAHARELLRPIKLFILEDEKLLADFPEAVFPLRRLENSSKRQGQQHVRGKLTHVHWGPDKLVFPTLAEEELPAEIRPDGRSHGRNSKFEIRNSKFGGAVIAATSLDSHLRGQQHARPDRTVVRPGLVLLDDPQTRESARSVDQTRLRSNLLHSDVLGMAGPGKTLSALVTCTVMYEGDLADTLLDKEKSPEWEGERTKMVYAWPTNQGLWDQYAEVRRTKGHKSAGKFYRDRQAEMDAGSKVAWPERYDADQGEISALQHAMNLKLRMGADGFQAECQNEPVLEQMAEASLTLDQVLGKKNGLKRGEVPGAATRLTMFVDIHDRLLYWMACAWGENFEQGWIIDYGAFPEQATSTFTLLNASHTLSKKFPGTGHNGAILAGLEAFLNAALQRDFNRAGGKVRLDLVLIDSGYKPALVGQALQKIGGSTARASKGVGIRAGRKPLAMYVRKPGEILGNHWYAPNVKRTGQYPYTMLDTNYWKSFVHAGLATAAGDRGSISLYGSAKTDHLLLAEHLARSEYYKDLTGPYGTVREWYWTSRSDNHWLDCLVGCAAAASIAGVRETGQETAQRVRKRYTSADLRRRR